MMALRRQSRRSRARGRHRAPRERRARAAAAVPESSRLARLAQTITCTSATATADSRSVGRASRTILGAAARPPTSRPRYLRIRRGEPIRHRGDPPAASASGTPADSRAIDRSSVRPGLRLETRRKTSQNRDRLEQVFLGSAIARRHHARNRVVPEPVCSVRPTTSGAGPESIHPERMAEEDVSRTAGTLARASVRARGTRTTSKLPRGDYAPATLRAVIRGDRQRDEADERDRFERVVRCHPGACRARRPRTATVGPRRVANHHEPVGLDMGAACGAPSTMANAVVERATPMARTATASDVNPVALRSAQPDVEVPEEALMGGVRPPGRRGATSRSWDEWGLDVKLLEDLRDEQRTGIPG